MLNKSLGSSQETKCQSMLKQKQVRGPLYSFFGGKQSSDDKEITQHLKHLLQPKKRASFHGRKIQMAEL